MKPATRQTVFAFPDDRSVQDSPDVQCSRSQDGGWVPGQASRSPIVPAPPVTLAIDAVELRRNPPRLLNFRELCTLLDISERHARDLIAERKLPSIRLGARLLFDTTKIFAALERMST